MAHGGKRPGSGRKPKAEEQRIIEDLTPLKKVALQKLGAAVKRGDSWAVKLYFEYLWGKPRQQMDITSAGRGLNPYESWTTEQLKTEDERLADLTDESSDS